MNWDDPILDAAATDTGMRRTNNQDSYTIVRASTPEAWKQRGHVFMVADGMGAHAVGELASKMACDNIPHAYNKAKKATPAEALTRAFRAVSAQIHSRASANADFQGMGTTTSALILGPSGALIAHVGDSRVYRIRGTRIDQLSFDHSLVWELVRRNHLSSEQASKAVPKNVITRSLGPDPNVEVDLEGPLPVELGDVYLLCSDGLSGLVTDPEIGAFAGHLRPQDSSRYLLHLANIRGGHDNITVVVLRIGAFPDDVAADPAEASKARGPKAPIGARLAGMIGSLARRPAPPPVEHEPYRSAACPADDALLEAIGEQIRNTQAAAIEQSWPLDWAHFANLRREVDEARSAGKHTTALRAIGEAIVLLGEAGRIHKKSSSAAHVS